MAKEELILSPITGINMASLHMFESVLFGLCLCSFLGGYAFLGSLIIKEVVNELLSKGLDKAKVLLLAGVRWVLTNYFLINLDPPRVCVRGIRRRDNGRPSQQPRSFCHQCWRRRRLGKRGPGWGAAALSGSPRSAGQRSGWLWVDSGEERIQTGWLLGCPELWSHWLYKAGLQVSWHDWGKDGTDQRA